MLKDGGVYSWWLDAGTGEWPRIFLLSRYLFNQSAEMITGTRVGKWYNAYCEGYLTGALPIEKNGKGRVWLVATSRVAEKDEEGGGRGTRTPSVV